MNYAIILAAGISQRITNQVTPKQFINLNNLPIICYSINTFNGMDEIDKVLVVIHKDWKQHLLDIFKNHNIVTKKIEIIIGGASRNASLLNAINHLQQSGNMNLNDVILTHDAARPFVSKEIVLQNILECKKSGACNTAIKCVDTVFITKDHTSISDIPDRNQMYASQTPQTFTWVILKNVYLEKKFDKQLFDSVDASTLVIKAGFKISIVAGNQSNFKITTNEDLISLTANHNKLL